MESFYILLVAAAVLVPSLGFAALYLLSNLTPWPRRTKSYFFEKRPIFGDAGGKHFPNLLRSDTDSWKGPQHTPPEVYLSVVIPAMNEKERLPIMLDECLEYLETRRSKDKAFTYEVILVDDGSKDNTAEVAHGYSAKYPVSVYKLEKNVGKGGAVRVGMLIARGRIILFADADGATKFSDFVKLEKELHRICNGESAIKEPLDWTHPALVVGSRAHLEKDSVATRSFIRTILMVGFHSLVYIFAVRTVKDTQCGFKLFSRAAAAKLFPQIHIERWAFDVELIYIAERLNFSIGEVGVQWTEVDGSKVTPLHASIQMGRDILLIWFRYLFGIWKISTTD